MTWLLRGSGWRLLVPLAAGAALSAALQAAEPAARLYAMVSPSLQQPRHRTSSTLATNR